jgi:argininosuccinate lyase
LELWYPTDEYLALVSAHHTPGGRDVTTVEGSLASRDAKGGTAPERVWEQLGRAAAQARSARAWASRPIEVR